MPRYMLTFYTESEEEQNIVETIFDSLSAGRAIHILDEKNLVYRLRVPNGLDREIGWDLADKEE